MYIYYIIFINKVHFCTSFFFCWKLIKDILKTTSISHLFFFFFEDISSLKTGILSRFIMIKNREIFCDLSRYWLSFKSMQCVETRNILKWCYKMHPPLLQTSTSNSNINIIMLIPHSILLFVFKSSIIICFILIIKRFFSNTNFTSSNNPLTPLSEKTNVCCERDCFGYNISYQTVLILLHFVNQSIRNIFLIAQIKKLHTFKLHSAYIIAYIRINHIVKTYLKAISR